MMAFLQQFLSIHSSCAFVLHVRFREDAIKGQAQFINVYSPDEELPKGSYGTSLLLPYALDPANDVILAYLQNQEPMKPDHVCPC